LLKLNFGKWAVWPVKTWNRWTKYSPLFAEEASNLKRELVISSSDWAAFRPSSVVDRNSRESAACLTFPRKTKTVLWRSDAVSVAVVPTGRGGPSRCFL
jgi:hypothetical protein